MELRVFELCKNLALPQHRDVPKKYFHRYIKKVEWCFNKRDKDLLILLRKILNQRIIKVQF